MTAETSVEETTAIPAKDDDDKTELGTTESQTDEDEGKPEGETDESESDGDDAPAKPKKNWAQKRIDELTRARREAERDRDYWRRQAAGEIPKPEAPKTDAEPNPKDFTDQAAYWRAVARYEARQVQVEHEQQAKQQTEQQRQQERVTSFLSADEAFAEQNPEYRGAAEIQYDPSFPITEGMAEAVFESEIGPQLLHYLDTHRDEAAQIVQMSNARAIAALGRIEERLSAKPTQKTTAPQKPVTQAPPPVPTAKPSAPSSKDPEKMSVAEWMEWRNRKLK